MDSQIKALTRRLGPEAEPDADAPLTDEQREALTHLKVGETADLDPEGLMLFTGRDEHGAYLFAKDENTPPISITNPRLRRILDRQGIRKWPRNW